MIVRRVVLAAIGVSTLWLALTGPVAGAQDAAKVRPAVSAGYWYPADPAVLTKQIDDALAKAAPPDVTGKPVALICPHAGYDYSAPTFAAACVSLRGQSYKRVIVLAFSHRNAGRYRGVHAPKDLAAYATPLGQVPIDRQACDQLLRGPGFVSTEGVDEREHSLELQLPFLQRVLKDFALVPLLVGQMTDAEYARAAQTIAPLVDEDTLVVASSDFTHLGARHGYQPFQDNVEKQLRDLAEQAAAPILRCDYDGFAAHLAKTHDTICGQGPILLLLRMLSSQRPTRAVRAAHDNTARVTKDWTDCVTYQSFVFVRRPWVLSEDERATLLGLARQTVTALMKGEPPPKPDAGKLSEGLRKDGACFVTLENRGQLRGCIGSLVADRPLYQSVIGNATAACRDSRFVDNAVTAKELDQLHIEISYLFLNTMKRVTNPDDIVVGWHGVIISLGGRHGLLLPQVAYRLGWTREEFLRGVCQKAGLPSDAWKRPEAEIQSYEAEVFAE